MKNDRRRQSSSSGDAMLIRLACIGAIVLFPSTSPARNNVAFGFGGFRGGKTTPTRNLEWNTGRTIGRGSSVHPPREAGRRRSRRHDDAIFARTDERAIADGEIPSPPSDEAEDGAPSEIVNGTAEGFVVTELYDVPADGFPEAGGGGDDAPSISSLFSPGDVARLRLEPRNVTLPAALMLLDPAKYRTQSRARKVVRQRSVCLRRDSGASSLDFDELGKVVTRVYAGDTIGFQRRAGSDYYAAQETPYRLPPFEVPVVYEDDRMAIVDKPAGVVMYRAGGKRGGGATAGSARGGGHGRDTLLSALPYVLRPSDFNGGDEEDRVEGETIPRRPQPVHRLDRPVSGLVVVAKTKAATTHLSQQFEFRRARKTYTAIVNGIPRQPTSLEDEESPSEWNTIDYDLEGKSAVTEWRVIREVKSLHGKDGRLTLVELKPRTGRYHQLRRHMAWACGSPLVGDTTYDGGDDSALRLRKRGLFLCSNGIELEHPYYNTPSGREEWTAAGGRTTVRGDATVWEDEGTGLVMVRAKIELPQKFESFLEREGARAAKFGS